MNDHNIDRSGLALTPEQAGQMLHRLEERLQAVEQDLADRRREMAEGLRLERRRQAQVDAGLWQLFYDLRSEVDALRAAVAHEEVER